MNNCVKETLCTNCEHRIVCKYKQDYLKILEAINNARVYFEADGGKEIIKKVIDVDYDFIEEIKVQCKYYYSHFDVSNEIGTITYC